MNEKEMKLQQCNKGRVVILDGVSKILDFMETHIDSVEERNKSNYNESLILLKDIRRILGEQFKAKKDFDLDVEFDF